MICVYCVTKVYFCKGQIFYEDHKHNNCTKSPSCFIPIHRKSQSNWEILSNCCSFLRKPKLYETSNASKHRKPRPFTFCPVFFGVPSYTCDFKSEEKSRKSKFPSNLCTTVHEPFWTVLFK